MAVRAEQDTPFLVIFVLERTGFVVEFFVVNRIFFFEEFMKIAQKYLKLAYFGYENLPFLLYHFVPIIIIHFVLGP